MSRACKHLLNKHAPDGYFVQNTLFYSHSSYSGIVPFHLSTKYLFTRLSLLALLLLLGIVPAMAQSSRRADSLAKARQYVTDSIRTARMDTLAVAKAAREKTADSLRIIRQHTLDSVKSVRSHFTDSLASIRKYRNSKHYADSVLHARTQRATAMHKTQQSRLDSLKAARKQVTDSLSAIRQASTATIRATQKARADSLLVKRKYRESKRYADSVVIVRRIHMDSLQTARKAISDRLAAVRKATLDSTKAVRKHITDSLTVVRTKVNDSLKIVRAARTAKADAAKAKRDADAKAAEVKKAKKFQLKIDMAHKKKQEQWNNDDMLKKHWGPPRSILQNLYTRDNYYFNARRKMEEAEENMQRVAKDDYDNRIALYSFNPDRDSLLLKSDMDSIIHKTSVGVQIHDPRAVWQDDLYLLMGRAFYYKGDYTNSIAAFHYIIAMNEKFKKDKAAKKAAGGTVAKKEAPSIVDAEKKGLFEFLKHQTAKNDALLWLSHVYVQHDETDNAESVLDLLTSDPKLPPDLKGRIALERAFLHLHQGNTRSAADELAIVAVDKNIPQYIRRRAAFLDGQLLQEQNRYKDAVAQFTAVTDLNPKIDMDFYARRNIAYNVMLGGGNQDDALVSLKHMLNDGKYAPYYEQVYYVLGHIAANSGNTKDAITYLQKSIHSPKTTRKQKAISFATLGNVYYANANYEAAQNAYDSVKALSSQAGDNEDVATALRRGKVLSAVTGPARIIHDQDSLLALAAMSEKDRLAVIRDHIRQLEKEKADSTYRAENAGIAAAQQDDGGNSNDATGGTSWYFANPTLMQQGNAEFKRKWGNRPLTDNWRRVSAQSDFHPDNTGTPDSASNGAEGATLTLDENGLPTEESLLGMIPSTPAAINASKAQVQQAYMDLGDAYITSMEDYTRAGSAFDTLDAQYANHKYKPEETYRRYQIALARNDLKLAQQYSTQLLQQYDTTQWASLVRPSTNQDALSTDTSNGPLLALAGNQSIAAYYDDTYDMLLKRSYDTVLTRVTTARRQYHNDAYNNRFMVLQAAALAGTGSYGRADTILHNFVTQHPTDTLRPWAESILKYIATNKPVPPKDTTIKKAVPGTTVAGGADSTLGKTAGQQMPAVRDSASNGYIYRPAEPHYFVFIPNKMGSNVLTEKGVIAGFNTSKFPTQRLTADMESLSPQQPVLLARGFGNATDAKAYLTTFNATPQAVQGFDPNSYKVFIISASNYNKLRSDKNITAYLTFFQANYK